MKKLYLIAMAVLCLALVLGCQPVEPVADDVAGDDVEVDAGLEEVGELEELNEELESDMGLEELEEDLE